MLTAQFGFPSANLQRARLSVVLQEWSKGAAYRDVIYDNQATTLFHVEYDGEMQKILFKDPSRKVSTSYSYDEIVQGDMKPHHRRAWTNLQIAHFALTHP